MKFMRLGCRPDTFYSTETARSVSSDVSSDLIIQVKEVRYFLHKFPLLSKCLKLQKLCSEFCESSQPHIIQLPDFPGGVEAFEQCAKFCYGIQITLGAQNIIAARCAAEYLQMTEAVEKGNLIYKLDVFFNSCVLQGWRDSIVVIQSTKELPLWSEDLGITGRCVDSIASKVLSCPSKINLSRSYSRRGARDDISCNGAESQRHKTGNKGWWAEDLAELTIDLYWRIMIAIKAGGRVPSNLIGDALKIYAARWLPNVIRREEDSDTDSGSSSDTNSRHRLVLESLVSLLPAEKGAVSCSSLLKILKAANVLNASSSTKTEMTRRVSLQLEEAVVSDLLIPSCSPASETYYDVDMVMTIIDQFMQQGKSPPTSPLRSKTGYERRRSRSAENINSVFQESRRSSSASHSSKLKVAKLVDKFLQEIARDANLSLAKFIAVAEAVPKFSRLDHDDLYRAIDIYLKAHPDMNKSERKRLCRSLDCKKLSVEACMDAAQNEQLPLRVVVQVLFYEQARAATSGGKVTELPSNLKALLASHGLDPSNPKLPLNSNGGIPGEENWRLNCSTATMSTLRMKLAEDDLDNSNVPANGIEKSGKFKPFCALPGKPKKMFSKLWSLNKIST